MFTDTIQNILHARRVASRLANPRLAIALLMLSWPGTTAAQTFTVWPVSWQPTKIEAQVGDVFSITAVGRWRDSVGITDANGRLSQPVTGPTVPLPGEPIMLLVLKVGENGRPIRVGTARTFTSPNQGVLQFAVNDRFDIGLGDNGGALTVTVTRVNTPSPTPLPGPYVQDFVKLDNTAACATNSKAAYAQIRLTRPENLPAVDYIRIQLSVQDAYISSIIPVRTLDSLVREWAFRGGVQVLLAMAAVKPEVQIALTGGQAILEVAEKLAEYFANNPQGRPQVYSQKCDDAWCAFMDTTAIFQFRPINTAPTAWFLKADIDFRITGQSATILSSIVANLSCE